MSAKFSPYVLFVVMIILVNACTENPFFDDRIEIKDKRHLQGKVIVGELAGSGSVFVWLDGFKLSAWSDSLGNYELQLPQAKTQPGGGLTGSFNLYCYIANYQVGIVSLPILDGQFEYGKGPLDAKGNLMQAVVLRKILDIQTTINPDTMTTESKDPIHFKVRLENLAEPVEVGTYHNSFGNPSCLVIRHEDDPIENALLLQGLPGIYKLILIDTVTVWDMFYQFSPYFFRPGTYEVTPYLQIQQKDLPVDLLKSIDENILEFNYQYLKWPLRHQAGRLTVVGLEGNE